MVSQVGGQFATFKWIYSGTTSAPICSLLSMISQTYCMVRSHFQSFQPADSTSWAQSWSPDKSLGWLGAHWEFCQIVGRLQSTQRKRPSTARSFKPCNGHNTHSNN